MDKLLQQYQKKFRCLEHCNPYHRMGDVEQWEKWAGMVSKNFVYTIKCNQYLTHTKMLEVDADTATHIQNFFAERITKLGAAFGAALVQLPPSFRYSEEHLERIKKVANLIPAGQRIAVEFRHPSWFNDQTYAVLRETKWALVATHSPETGDTPVVETGAGFMYVRLHGSIETYSGDYGLAVLRLWKERVKRFTVDNPTGTVFFFFNNNESHVNGLTSSVADATALAECLDVDEVEL